MKTENFVEAENTVIVFFSIGCNIFLSYLHKIRQKSKSFKDFITIYSSVYKGYFLNLKLTE